MKILETKLDIGIEKPFRIIHISDTHLTYADMRDGERKVKMAKERGSVHFPHADSILEFACNKAKEMGVPIVHTGDLIDFVSLANLEKAKDIIDNNDIFLAAGNHEFSLYLGEEKEDAAYRNRSLKAVQASFKNDIRMCSRVIGGVNFVAVDDGYYLFEKEQLDFLKKECEKGLPIILLLHVPLYDRALYDFMMERAGCGFLTGVPEELLKVYPPHLAESHKADSITLETIEYIKGQTMIKALITGHIHRTYDGVFNHNVPQITTACTDIRIIEIQ